MKYCFCTIAIGETYYNSAINFAKKLNVLSNNHHYIIVTDNIKDEIPNTTFVQIPKNEVLFIGKYFNYNLKYYPIKCGLSNKKSRFLLSIKLNKSIIEFSL